MHKKYEIYLGAYLKQVWANEHKHIKRTNSTEGKNTTREKSNESQRWKKKRTSKPLNQSEKLTANGQNSAAHIAQVVNMNDALPFWTNPKKLSAFRVICWIAWNKTKKKTRNFRKEVCISDFFIQSFESGSKFRSTVYIWQWQY